MEIVKNEEELKHVLDSKGFKFGDRFPTVGFVVTFLDKQTSAQIHSIVVKDPIDGIANLPGIAKMAKRNVDSLQIVLDFGFDYNTRKIADISYELDPYIYFTKEKEVVVGEQTTEKSE